MPVDTTRLFVEPSRPDPSLEPDPAPAAASLSRAIQIGVRYDDTDDGSDADDDEEEYYDDDDQPGPSHRRNSKVNNKPRHKRSHPLREGKAKQSRWTSEQSKIVFDMMSNGKTGKEVHAALGGAKTISSIISKYWRLKGGDPKASNKRKKTEGNDQQINKE